MDACHPTLKTTKNCVRRPSCEGVRRCAKVCEGLCEGVRRCAKVCESLCECVRMCAKVCEGVRRCAKVVRMLCDDLRGISKVSLQSGTRVKILIKNTPNRVCELETC